jgi:transcriptional regulator with XRE-family HTH domain
MDDKLVTYVNAQLRERGWSLRELARRSGLSHTIISLGLNEQRPMTFETVDAIARALGEPPEKLFRMAGLLPARTTREELIEEIIHYFDQLDQTDQLRLITIAWSLSSREDNGPAVASSG